MKEDFLHYVWQFSQFNGADLKTTTKEKIQIIKPGLMNNNAGPDFLQAQIFIDEVKWIGNVEVHLKSSDWYIHKHEQDKNYDAVILHVVYEDDVTVFAKNNKPLPTLELKGKIPDDLIQRYKALLNSKNKIPCANQIHLVDDFVMNNWLERLYIQRLEHKSVLIEKLLQENHKDYEAVLFQLLAKNFGLKVNAEVFLALAKRIDFSVFRKEWFNVDKLSALLFGEAGFLNEEIENDYYQYLKKEYEYQKIKYKLTGERKNQFQFFRIRPNNFPTIRIAQLVALYVKNQGLFSKIMNLKKVEDFYGVFKIEIPEFWKTHYTFEKESKKSSKGFTKPFINLLLINTIIPLKYVHAKFKFNNNEFDYLKLLTQLPKESNSIISNFHDLELSINNAFDSQSLLELNNSFCAKKRCLHCSVGTFLLKKQ